jgi:hypothetical protein
MKVGRILMKVGRILMKVGRILMKVGRILMKVGRILMKVGHLFSADVNSPSNHSEDSEYETCKYKTITSLTI